jgi:hypothetical protein
LITSRWFLQRLERCAEVGVKRDCR